MLRLAEVLDPVANDLEESLRIFREELGSDEPFVRDLCQHIEHFRGKQLRPALLLLTGQACGGLRQAHHVLAAVVELVHVATLVHDDVLDEADVRRRAATVSRRWGIEPAVLLGDFLFSHAYRLCSTLDDQFAALLIGRTAVTLCTGELMQVSNRNNFDLTEAEYFQIIESKTAALIGACCLLGARYAGADDRTVQRMRGFGVPLGTAFQITDDLLDLLGNEAEVGKSLGRDAQQGKLTLPLIHYLRTADPEQRHLLLTLLASDTHERQRQIAALLAGSDSIEYARQIAEEHVRHALDLLAELPPSDARTSLTALAEFIVTRRQ